MGNHSPYFEESCPCNIRLERSPSCIRAAYLNIAAYLKSSPVKYFPLTFTCWIVFTGLFCSSFAHSDNNLDTISFIEKMGGTVQEKGGHFEIDFHLRGRALNDDQLSRLAKLKNVVALNLSNTKITSAGLVHLQDFDKLRWLHLEKTQVGDDGIDYLSQLPNLEYLNLYSTNITDKSLEKLSQSKRLARLYVWQTSVTDTGIAKLKKAIPQLKIVRGLDLNKLATSFPAEAEIAKPTLVLDWVAINHRSEAPPKSETGINCQLLFENKSAKSIKLYWITYGNGELQFYAKIAPGATRQQNSYARNVWLVTDDDDQPLGYFLVGEDNASAVIPSEA
ncbi:MAG: hypothetical protein GY768_18380 [Planctomycetaceae bacterium]|nr:hypothetical protein [Planctomycetaceae bacterium]